MYEDITKLTRGTKTLIQKAITETNGSTNRHELLNCIVNIVIAKYKDLNLDYQLKRMNLETTGAILRAIDTYFFKYMTNSTNE